LGYVIAAVGCLAFAGWLAWNLAIGYEHQPGWVSFITGASAALVALGALRFWREYRIHEGPRTRAVIVPIATSAPAATPLEATRDDASSEEQAPGEGEEQTTAPTAPPGESHEDGIHCVEDALSSEPQWAAPARPIRMRTDLLPRPQTRSERRRAPRAAGLASKRLAKRSA
jgi:hypothetical protein